VLFKKKAQLQDLIGGSNTDRLVLNAHLYALADKYRIEDLKLLATAKFLKVALQSWRSKAFG